MEEQRQKPLAAMLDSINIAEKLSEEQLTAIGADAYAGFDVDLQSRLEWEQHIEAWTKLAKQTVEEKSYPWPNASNIKYPLLSTAAMQFAARAYPSLLPSNGKIVAAKPIGKDPDGSKLAVAAAVSTYMSYQLLEEMDGWEEEMDKMLVMLPVVGTMFKKTYWDSVCERNKSVIVMPKHLVVNYWTRTLKESERISEIIEMSPRKVKERQQAGLWRTLDLGAAPLPNAPGGSMIVDDTTPYTIIEQHTFLDLDEDGYEEPYIVTFHKESRKVLRIAANYEESGIKLNEDGGVIKIDPIQYYTKFGFIPNPDGSFYDIGFGMLLGPLNESVNTLINQLLDSGHMSTLQAGFIGKGLRIKMGDTSFQPGEWKSVNGTGDDLKKQIVPLPVREPSNVLFQLMGSLITSGKELASIAEIFTGKMPGQNTPATTTMATVEQGMKVFTAVYKRLYRALSEEFLKLARLNYLYLNPQTYVDTVDMQVGPEDFNMKAHQIYPGADPNAVSHQEKLMKAQGLLELLPTGILDPLTVVKRVLEAQEQPNWEELLNPQIAQTGQMPPPPPDPKILAVQAKSQAEQQKIALMSQAQQNKMQLDQSDRETKQAMKAQEHAQNMQIAAEKAVLEGAISQHKASESVAQDRANMMQKLLHKDSEHSQKMQQGKVVSKQQAKKPSNGAK